MEDGQVRGSVLGSSRRFPRSHGREGTGWAAACNHRYSEPFSICLDCEAPLKPATATLGAFSRRARLRPRRSSCQRWE